MENPTPPGADVDKMNAELQELYKTLSDKIALSVANGHFSAETFQIILSKVVETIEEFSEAGAKNLTGLEKRNLAINLMKMVLNDLHTRGQLNDELFAAFNTMLVYGAPVLFAAAKAAWTKLQSIEQDVEAHGCKGCFKRNF